MYQFQYHPDLLAAFPAVQGGVIVAEELANGPTPAGLQAAYAAEQIAVKTRIGQTPLSQLPEVHAWRRAFRAFGMNPTQYRSASEALLRRLTKKGDIPNINLLVDLGNLVSIRYALPVAIFDTKECRGTLTVRFADGSERFTPLFQDTIEHPQPGEVVFADDTGLVFSRRWCWRQSAQSAANPQTTSAIITVEAHHPAGFEAVQNALTDLQTLLTTYAGGSYTTGIANADRPGI
jgi:DNA/RNA-binding domain of Phe-tRNA-synthetase-like protein